MFNPFYEPKSLSDDELFNKITEVNKRLSNAALFKMSEELKDQLKLVHQQLMMEFTERQKQSFYNLYKDRITKTIETDEIVTDEDEDEKEEAHPKKEESTTFDKEYLD